MPRKRVHEALREIVNVGRDFAGVDITKEPIHIKPGNHYIMGGVKTDVDGQTEVPGLYAAGECACVSVHGGNRLGANSLLDTLVFGRRAGAHAAARASDMVLNPPSEALLADEERQHRRADPARAGHGPARRRSCGRSWATTMDRYCAVFRDAEGLQTALETVKRLKEEYEGVAIDDRGSVFNQDLLGAIELGYMLDCAEATVISAIHRTESRGAHFRTDFPERNDEEWLKHINLTLGADGEPHISYSPGDDHTVAAGGAEILRRMADYTLQDPPPRPRDRRRPLLGRLPGRPRGAPLACSTASSRRRTASDGSIGIRCSCQAAICGSCGVRVNGQAKLACNTKLSDAAASTADDGAIVVEPMGNMPVLKDLIVNMDAVHWKKVQRVVPWLLPAGDPPEREYVVPAESMIDVTQSMACIHCGACVSDCLSMEVDPLFIGPAALAKAYRFVGDPRDAQTRSGCATSPRTRTASTTAPTASTASRSARRASRRWTRSCACAAARRGTTRSTTRTTAAATRRRSRSIIRKKGILDERKLLQDSFGPFRPQGAAGADPRPADRPARLRAREDHAQEGALPREAAGRRERAADLRARRAAPRGAEPLHRGRGRRRGREGAGDGRDAGGDDVKVAYWPGCVSRGFTPELHGSMALVAEQARHRAGGARPRELLRRRRDRRAQPGAGRHAQRAHVRDGAEDRPRR